MDTVHFVWIQDQRPWGLGEQIALLSALKNTTYRVLLHTNLTPTSGLSPFTITHDRFQIRPREFDFTVEGVRARPANLSDLARIQILYTEGGIYSDLDIWWLRDIDVPEGVVAAYENPAYRTVANAFMASPPGWPGWLILEEQMRDVFRKLAAKGVVDLRGDTGGLLNVKHHALLWKLTGDFLKSYGATFLGKSHFYKNGWRRIGRAVRRAGGASRVDPACLGDTADSVSLSGITGFHYYAGLYDAEAVLLIPAVAAFAAEFLPPVLQS